MRGLAGEAEHVALDAEGAEHDAGGLVHRFEHRPLFDVQLQIGARVNRFQLGVRFAHPLDVHAVLRQRVDQARAVAIDQLAHLVDLQAAGGGRRAEQAAAEAGAFLVGPVHQLQRDRRPPGGVHAQHFERGHHAETSVQPSAVRHRIEMAADDDRARRVAADRHPVVAGGIGLDGEPEFGDPGGEPRARLAPHRSPGQPLGPIGGRRARRQLTKIGNHSLCVHWRVL